MARSFHLKRNGSKGFTLVELSIVLVIIGLLLGSVLAGQSMIRSMELQSVISDVTKYKDMAVQFKKQYNAIPGDMVDAEQFWGKSTACAGLSTTGTCNGDGNSLVQTAGSPNATNEIYQFWRQLVLAGKIVGSYSGTSGSGGGVDSVAGVNVPLAHITNGGWDTGSTTADGTSVITIPDTHYTLDYGNFFRIGAKTSGSSYTAPLFKPDDAASIDTKIDDGLPGRGGVIASHPTTCATATSVTDYDKPYALSSKSVLCTLFFIGQY